MMPAAAIAFACRSAISVNCGSVFTAESPCSRLYCEIIAAMSSACASVAVTAKPTTKQTTLITALPSAYEAAPVGRAIISFPLG